MAEKRFLCSKFLVEKENMKYCFTHNFLYTLCTIYYRMNGFVNFVIKKSVIEKKKPFRRKDYHAGINTA